jgi:glutamyl-tRNA reductase
MSGETAARALGARFDAIRRAEMTRLRKKLACFSASDRAAVDAITAHVIDAIAAAPAPALARDQRLVRVIADLFDVS